MSLSLLALDVLGCIYSYLRLEDQLAFRLVCSHWHHVIKLSGVNLSETALLYRDPAECPKLRFARFIRGVTLPQGVTPSMLAMLPLLPELTCLSVPSMQRDFPVLPTVKHLTIRLAAATHANIKTLRETFPALVSVDVDVSLAQPQLLQLLPQYPVTRLAIQLNAQPDFEVFQRFTSLTELDLTLLSFPGYTYNGVTVDLQGLLILSLRSLSILACNYVTLRLPYIHTLESLSIAGDRLSIAAWAGLSPRLSHLATNTWAILNQLSSPTALRSLSIASPIDQLPDDEAEKSLSRLVSLSTLLLPLHRIGSHSFLRALTRLEELGGGAFRAEELTSLVSLRTLRQYCSLASLLQPVPQVRALHVIDRGNIDGAALCCVSKWTNIRDLTLKGMWTWVSREEWLAFAKAMPQLLVLRMLYLLRKPHNEIIAGASAAFVGRRLVIEE